MASAEDPGDTLATHVMEPDFSSTSRRDGIKRSCASAALARPRFSTTHNSPDARKEQNGGQGDNGDFSGLPSKSHRPAMGNSEGRYGAVGEAGNGNANTIVIVSSKF